MIRRLACAMVLLASVPAFADEAAVAPPAGAALLLEVEADGVQIYTCTATDKGPGWVFKAPEANLFDATGRQVGTHFAGPGWKLDDGSAVTGAVIAKADAPVAGAVPWLLLAVKTHEGAGKLAAVATIRRADTKGGAGPASGCDAGHVGAEARMRYSARYQFFGVGK